MVNRFIEKLRGFGDLADADIAALERATSRPTLYPPRTDLIREGDDAGAVFIALEGWLFRYKVLPTGTRQVLAFLMPGDASDLANGRAAHMDHSIQTQTAATVVRIERAAMDALMSGHPAIVRAMYSAQLFDESTLRTWIVSLGRRSSAQRAAHFLIELYIRVVRRGLDSQDGVELPISQVVLADALSLTPVHINRVLQDFRRSGAIELRRGALRIQNAAALTRISGFGEDYIRRQLRPAD